MKRAGENSTNPVATQLKLTPTQHKKLAELLKIRLTPYIPHAPHPTQHAFLWLTCLEALYGGAAGGGKSDALLMAALQYVDVPGYNAILFRKTYSDLNLPGSLIPRSHEWLNQTDAKWNENDARWTFPSGATLSFGYMRNDDDRHRYQCFAPGTEILTEYGWQAVQDLEAGTLAATLDPETREMLYEPVVDTQEYEYEGDLVEVYGEQGVSFAVTPEHRIWHSTPKCSKLTWKHAKSLPSTAHIPQWANWSGGVAPGGKTFSTPGANGKTIRMDSRAWASFLGWYLAEGSLTKAGVQIAQHTEPGISLIKGVLSGMEGHWRFDEAEGRFVISSKTLRSYMSHLGVSKEKFIPADVMDWDKEHLQLLLDALVEGDGTWRRGGENGHFVSSSKQLADDVCEVAFKCGYRPTICERTEVTNYSRGRLATRWHVSLLRKNTDTALPKGWQNSASTFYKGPVYCVTVPPHHTVLIRYRGRVSWSGQSAEFQFCVAKGTGILMDNGSLRPIEDVRVGDKVQTFIGPKDVLAVHRVGVRSLASIETPAGRASVSVGHPLLTPFGWASPYEMIPSLFGEACKRSSTWVQKSPTRPQQTVHPLEDLWRTCVLASLISGDSPRQAFSSKVDALLGNYGTECGGSFPAILQPPLAFVPLRLHEPSLRLAAVGPLSSRCGTLSGRRAWLSPSVYDDYSVFPSCGGLRTGAGEVFPSNTPQQAGAALPTRAYPHEGGLTVSPERSPQGLSSLVHPYTREDLDAFGNWVDLWSAVSPAGAGECWDLTVSGASHYIIANGVSSSQCGYDELTHFSKLQYTYMFSRLRKPKDLSSKNPLAEVPLRMRSASNPGGRGHLWVKQRFVKPRGQREDEPDDPTQRVFIPAKLADNPSVDEDTYRAALEQLDESTQMQLIHGDWDAREPGPWVIPDPSWIDAAVAKGLELWEAGGVPRDFEKPICFCIDWGEFTQAYMLTPMPNGGVYVLPSEIVGEHDDPGSVGLRMLKNAEYMGVKPTVARYDAAGIQSMRTFARTARSREGWERLKTQKVAFGKYKKESINYLRLLFKRVAADRQDRVIAIHPANQVLIRQLRGWVRKNDESEDVEKVDDHGPDALVAGVAPVAAAHREYIEAMLRKAKEKKP